MGSTSAHTNEGLGRRDLIKRSAAIGLISVPTMGFLSACASSDSGGNGKVEKGTKSEKNPLGVNESAPLDFVLFDGGFGQQYAKDAVKVYETNYPKAKVKFTPTQKITTTLQPRFNGGNPPDLIDNSGA
ncbi:Sugar ABC transporter sugar-binding protein, partial [Streptomyces venezuelae ATCC 10712]